MTASRALTNIAQLVIRQRFGDLSFTSQQVGQTVLECSALFATTEKDRSDAIADLLQRYLIGSR